MKKYAMRVTSAIICLMILFSAVSASARASERFTWTEVTAFSMGNRVLRFEFDMIATGKMQELGVSKIVVYRQVTSSSATPVKTFTRDNTAGLIAYNEDDKYGYVEYTGIAGADYFAQIYLYAKNSSGSETLIRTTNLVTAR